MDSLARSKLKSQTKNQIYCLVLRDMLLHTNKLLPWAIEALGCWLPCCRGLPEVAAVTTGCVSDSAAALQGSKRRKHPENTSSVFEIQKDYRQKNSCMRTSGGLYNNGHYLCAGLLHQPPGITPSSSVALQFTGSQKLVSKTGAPNDNERNAHATQPALPGRLNLCKT